MNDKIVDAVYKVAQKYKDPVNKKTRHYIKLLFDF